MQEYTTVIAGPVGHGMADAANARVDLAERRMRLAQQDMMNAARRIVQLERSERELEALKARVSAAVAAFDEMAAEIGGCGGAYCLVTGKSSAPRPGAGCYCNSNMGISRMMMGAGRRLRDALAEPTEDAGEKPPPDPDYLLENELERRRLRREDPDLE